MKNNNKFLHSSYHRQQGITMWSFLFVGAVIIFCVIVGTKLVPVYSESVAIKDALDASVESVPRADVRKKKIVKDIDKRLYIDGFYDIPDLNEAVEIKKERTGTTITLDYKKEVPLFYNIGIYLDFKYIVEK